ncbi:MAG: hypothetical protein WBA33_03870 [Rhodanobacter lindaniclasticus]
MFDVIDFLESAGQDAGQYQANTGTWAAALREMQIAPELQAALLTGDGQGLAAMLGKRPDCCYINPGKEDQDEEDGEKPDQKDKDGETGGRPRQTPAKAPD